MHYNGPAIWGGCVTRRNSGRTLDPVYLAEKFFRPEKEGMAHFLPSRYKAFLALRVSRYEFDRSHEFIPFYKFGGVHLCSEGGTIYLEDSNLSRCRILNFLQMCVSGCKNHYKFVLGARAKAKSVTNNLPILSVF